jgi:hypothetical protein
MPYVQVVDAETENLLEDIQVDKTELTDLVGPLYDLLTEEYTIQILDDDSPRMNRPEV